MSIFKKDKGVFFKIPKKLKKELDKHIIDYDLTKAKFFIPLIKNELKYCADMDKMGKEQ